MKKCPKCLKKKHLSEFSKKLGGLQSECKECHRGYVNTHYEANKQYYKDKAERRKRKTLEWIKGQREKPCTDCGGGFPPWVMQFDHLPGQTKLFNVGDRAARSYSLDKLRREIAKCELVCANCHINRTYQRKQYS